MRLHYFEFDKLEAGLTNFGDDLNPWLWSRLLPDFFDDDEEEVFVGIGTILNQEIPRAKRVIVFGSGAGYGQPPTIDETYDIYCVRGPLTAQRIGIDQSKGVCDPAILVKLLLTEPESRRGIGFMPHIMEARLNGNTWKQICEISGMVFIDPRSEISVVLAQINSVQKLVTEALHGAVVADALRVPWVPVVLRYGILSFKWQDWMATLGLQYHPQRVRGWLLRSALSKLDSTGAIGRVLTIAASSRHLGTISRSAAPTLSSDRIVRSLLDQLQELLARLRMSRE